MGHRDGTACHCFLLVIGLGLAVAPPAPAEEPPDPDEALLQQAHISTDDMGLLAFMARQTATDDELRRIPEWVRRLASDDFQSRDEASRQLAQIGLPATPALRRALESESPELAREARVCLRHIPLAPLRLQEAAIRVLVRRHPAGAVATLIRFLPSVAWEPLQEETWFGLDALAARASHTDPALLAGLKDPLAERRAVAACILGRRGGADERKQVAQLLGDASPEVRLRAAQGLLAGKNTAGVSVLIALLDDPAVEVAWQAEELLHWAAGEDAPDLAIGSGGSQARRRGRAAWEDWWRKQWSHLDLAKNDQRPERPGLLLTCEDAINSVQDGRVSLRGCDGRVRWQVAGLRRPVDARLLPGGRVLIAEGDDYPVSWPEYRDTILQQEPSDAPSLEGYQPPERKLYQVTERDLAGKSVWQYRLLTQPLAVERLPNGNTFMSLRLGGGFTVREVTRTRLEIYRRDCLLEDIVDSFPPDLLPGLDNARLVYPGCKPGSPELLLEFDALAGQEWRLTRLKGMAWPEARIESLPQGRLLVACPGQNRVYELDGRRHVTGSQDIPSPSEGTLLPNQNLLITRPRTPRGEGPYGALLQERARDGKVLWEAVATEPVRRTRICLPLVRLGFDSPRPADLDLANSVPWLLARLRSHDPYVRERSAQALSELDANGPDVVGALFAGLDEPNKSVRNAVLASLLKLGGVTLPHALQAAKNPRPAIRAGAIDVLGQQVPQSSKVAAAILEATKDPNVLVRREAVYQLYALDPQGKGVMPALIMALGDPDRDSGGREATVAVRACGVLRSFGHKASPALSALIQSLDSDDWQLRSVAEAAIAAMGPAGKAAIPRLMRLLQEQPANDPPNNKINLQAGAVWALGKLGPDARIAVPMMIKALETDQDPRMRGAAAEALGNFGDGAKHAIPALRKALQDQNEDVRRAAKGSLEALNKGN